MLPWRGVWRVVVLLRLPYAPSRPGFPFVPDSFLGFGFRNTEQPEGGEGPPRLARLLTVHIPPSLTDAL